MDRLFLGFHIKLTLSLLLAVFLSAAIIAPRVERQVLHNIEESLAVPLLVMADSLVAEQTRTPGHSAQLEQIARRHPIPLALLSRQQLLLSAERLARLERGEVVAGEGRFLRAILYVRIGSTDQFVRLGPLNPIHPLGQGRGLAILLLGLGGLSFGVFLLVRPLRKRLAALSRAAKTFGQGELEARAVVDSHDAVGTLAADFNRMADEIQRLIASQQELLRMVSHELRTPLQRMHFTIEKLRGAEDQERRLVAIGRIERDVRELDSMIDELLTYVRLEDTQPPQRESVDLQLLVNDVIDAQSELANEVELGAAVSPGTSTLGLGNTRLLHRAVGNLIKNGIHHARSRVDVTISQGHGQLQLDVDDDGPGIPRSLRERLFQPFSRLAIERRRGPAGYGLGLAIVQRIAAQHQGRITVDESPLGGARFRLSLPSIRAGQDVQHAVRAG